MFRVLTKYFWFLAVLFLCPLLLGGCLALDPGTQPRRLGDTVLKLDTVWSGEIVIDGAVKVAKGAKLVITPGTDIRFVRRDLDQDGLGDATLVVEGELLAVGSPQAPIRFRSAEKDPKPGDWLEIRVDFSRDTTLRWCEIRDSAHTLHAHFTRGRMEDCHIHHNIDGSRLGEARFVIRNCLIEDNIGKGINFRNASVEIAWNVIRRNRAGLFLFETDRESSIHHNNFVDNGDNLRLGDFFTGEVSVRDNWWGDDDPAIAGQTIYDHKADPSIGTVHIAPASAWWREAGQRRKLATSVNWKMPTGGFVDSAAVSDGERFYLVGWDGYLRALSLAGQQLWAQRLDDVADADPLVTAGKIFVQDWSRTVSAFKADTGQPLWRHAYPESPYDDHRQGGLSRAGTQVLVPAWNGSLYALDLESGTPLWSYDTDGALRSRPLVLNEMIVVASEDGKLHALSPNGQLLWTYDTGNPLRAAPVALDEGVVAVGRSGRVVALASDGSLIWQRELGEECFYAAPLVADSAVLVATAGGSLWKLATKNGEPVWRVNLASPLFATPMVVDGTVILGDNCGRLLFVDLVSGAEIGSFATGDAVQSRVLQYADQLVFGSRDGNVRSLSLESVTPGTGSSR